MSDNGTAASPTNLAKEIQEGCLKLRATSMFRFQFSFNVGDHPIGIFGIESNGPSKVALIRRWNRDSAVLDPASGLYHANEGRQFGRIRPESPLFLVEFTPGFYSVISRVAFKAKTIRDLPAMIPGMPADYRFECVELSDLEIIG